MKVFWIIVVVVLLFSCNANTDNSTQSKDSVIYTTSRISEIRETVNPSAVKTYDETIKSFETTDYFKVSLFETKQTFKYLIKISYKNLNEEDTLNVPNFGEVPEVEIKKGDKRPSCIVGFVDGSKQFRESKLIYFEDGILKIHVLKHYGVFAKEKT